MNLYHVVVVNLVLCCMTVYASFNQGRFDDHSDHLADGRILQMFKKQAKQFSGFLTKPVFNNVAPGDKSNRARLAIMVRVLVSQAQNEHPFMDNVIRNAAYNWIEWCTKFPEYDDDEPSLMEADHVLSQAARAILSSPEPDHELINQVVEFTKEMVKDNDHEALSLIACKMIFLPRWSWPVSFAIVKRSLNKKRSERTMFFGFDTPEHVELQFWIHAIRSGFLPRDSVNYEHDFGPDKIADLFVVMVELVRPDQDFLCRTNQFRQGWRPCYPTPIAMSVWEDSNDDEALKVRIMKKYGDEAGEEVMNIVKIVRFAREGAVLLENINVNTLFNSLYKEDRSKQAVLSSNITDQSCEETTHLLRSHDESHDDNGGQTSGTSLPLIGDSNSGWTWSQTEYNQATFVKASFHPLTMIENKIEIIKEMFEQWPIRKPFPTTMRSLPWNLILDQKPTVIVVFKYLTKREASRRPTVIDKNNEHIICNWVAGEAGNLKIMLTRWTEDGNTTRRWLTLFSDCLIGRENEAKRPILIQYHGWPEGVVPDLESFQAMWNVYRSARAEKAPSKKVVVHCSGDERCTGTFLAINMAVKMMSRQLEMGEQINQVLINDIVMDIKKKSLVLTKAQFQFVFDFLIHWFKYY